MTTKHTPATPLRDFTVDGFTLHAHRYDGKPCGAIRLASTQSEEGREALGYIAHAANQYGVLVEALREIRATTTDKACWPIIDEALTKAGEL